MKKLIGLSLAVAMAASLSACNTPQGQNAVGGALIGGGAGALLGSAIGHGRPRRCRCGRPDRRGCRRDDRFGLDAAAGSACCAEWYYDYYGNRVCRSYY